LEPLCNFLKQNFKVGNYATDVWDFYLLYKEHEDNVKLDSIIKEVLEVDWNSEEDFSFWKEDNLLES